MGAGTDDVKKDRAVARDVLYTCLDRSFRLMHPLLPYVTEELYQRLPPSPAKLDTITIAPYPTAVIAWKNEAIEKEMEMAKMIASSFRSMKTSLGMEMKARPKGYVRYDDKERLKTLAAISSQISTQALIGEIAFIGMSDPKPPGTLCDVVSDKCLNFIEADFKNLAKVLDKTKKDLVSNENKIRDYENKIAAPAYAEKATESVREQHTKILEETRTKVAQLCEELKRLQEAMQN